MNFSSKMLKIKLFSIWRVKKFILVILREIAKNKNKKVLFFGSYTGKLFILNLPIGSSHRFLYRKLLINRCECMCELWYSINNWI